MRRIALVHTVKGVLNSFEGQLRAQIDEELLVHNLLDDFLATDPNRCGEFTIDNRNRLLNDLRSAELTGAELIVVTCSTLTPWVVQMRPLFRTPIVAIDDAMSRTAVESGARIHILASAPSTIEPTRQKLYKEAEKLGKTLTIGSTACEPAFWALGKLDMPTHDRLLKETAAEIRDVDVVVLAQASMAHLQEQISEICGCKTLSSPSLCIAQIKQMLAKGEC